MSINPEKYFVVDGLNICKENPRGEARLTVLLSLLIALKRKKCSFFCIFDESAFAEFIKKEKPISDAYKELTTNYEEFCVQIRDQADEKIIICADDNHCRIITNDRYKDWKQKYPWISNRGQLVKVSVVGGIILSETLDIKVREIKDVTDAWEGLKILLEEPNFVNFDSRRVKSVVPIKEISKKVLRVEPAKTGNRKRVTDPEEIELEMDGPQLNANTDNPITALLNAGHLSPEVARILQLSRDEEITEVRTRKNEMKALVFVVDKSGSMDEWQRRVIEGQKWMFEALEEASPKFDIRLAQILFNHEVDYFQPFCEFRDKDGTVSRDVRVLSRTNYVPGGFTALYDAVLAGVSSLTPIIYESLRVGFGLDTSVCIVTDGKDEGELLGKKGSRVSPEELGTAIRYMTSGSLTSPPLINKIILAGIGNFDYKAIGQTIGIDEIVQVAETNDAEVRRAFRTAIDILSDFRA